MGLSARSVRECLLCAGKTGVSFVKSGICDGICMAVGYRHNCSVIWGGDALDSGYMGRKQEGYMIIIYNIFSGKARKKLGNVVGGENLNHGFTRIRRWTDKFRRF